jgi:hypothetical protein
MELAYASEFQGCIKEQLLYINIVRSKSFIHILTSQEQCSKVKLSRYIFTPRPNFTPGDRTPGTHGIGGWVGLIAGLDIEPRGKIICLCQNQTRAPQSSSL